MQVSLPSTNVGLPAYYVLAVSEASSNLARYDGVRYGLRMDSDELRAMYDGSRGKGLGEEVKRRILMGTYALSAGYYDAFYKRAQQVRRGWGLVGWDREEWGASAENGERERARSSTAGPRRVAGLAVVGRGIGDRS